MTTRRALLAALPGVLGALALGAQPPAMPLVPGAQPDGVLVIAPFPRVLVLETRDGTVALWVDVRSETSRNALIIDITELPLNVRSLPWLPIVGAFSLRAELRRDPDRFERELRYQAQRKADAIGAVRAGRLRADTMPCCRGRLL